MYFTPTIFITQLLAAMQVLMTLDMPLSTTMALPVTSKPIESTVENLAWQAWIELPPEQKQQVKSRKVTPKSIFTLPNRIECPENHKQVDTKCIPIVIGTNADLINLNYLSLVVGNNHNEEQYDYDDEIVDTQLSYGPQMQIGEAEKSVDGLEVELKPPSKDEPLKFNIFENKFNIFHDEPLEDYSSISNEGEVQSTEKENNTTVIQTTGILPSFNATVNVTAINDLVSEASNISQSNLNVVKEPNRVASDSELAESNTLTTLTDATDFKIDAISLPAAAAGLEIQNPHKLSIFHKDSSIHLVTTVMNTASEKTDENVKKQQQQDENDIQTLLQTESLLPLLNQATATTFVSSPLAESSALTTVSTDDQFASSGDSLTLNIGEDEEMTTLPNLMEQEFGSKDKTEYTRSVTMIPILKNEDNDEVNDTTLETTMNDEPLEYEESTTTTIQLDDTTIIDGNIDETSTSLSSPALAESLVETTQQNLKELLLKQEQALKDFEELQRMRKGQKDQHTVLKKSKVEPVEVLATTATTATTSTTTTTTLPISTKTMDELITAETVTPLLTVHNENDNNHNNNDRFYYQHFAKQDLEETQQPLQAVVAAAETKSKQPTSTEELTQTPTTSIATTEIETIPTTKTSEIDLAEELRIINELVKGISPATSTTIKTKIPSTSTETITTLNDDVSSSSFPASTSESTVSTLKPTLSTSQIWSKIMPLLTTPQEMESSTSSLPTTQNLKSFSESSSISTETSESSNSVILPSSSNRSHRNSKIIRINGFSSITSNNLLLSSSTTTEEPSSSSNPTTSTTTEETSSTEDNSYEPYWWLPVAWRLDKSVTTEKQHEQEVKEEEQPLLLRFWSAYHAPRSS